MTLVMHFHLRRRRQPILLNARLQRAATRHREGATAGQEREEAMSDRFRPLPPVLWRRDHPRAALRHLSLNANEMRKIFSNICITLNPDNTLPIKESAIILSTADNNPGYPRRTSKTTPTSPSPRRQPHVQTQEDLHQPRCPHACGLGQRE